MKYLILLLSLTLTKCGGNLPQNKLQEEKNNKSTVNVSNLFKFLEEGNLGAFNKEFNNFSLEDLNSLNKNKTLLMIAVEKGYEDVVKNLLKKGVDVNKENLSMETALYFAFASKNQIIKNLLQESGAYATSKILELEIDSTEKEQIENKIEEIEELTRDLFNKIFQIEGYYDDEGVKEEINIEEEIKKSIEKGANLNIKSAKGRLLLLNYIYSKEGLELLFSKLELLIKYGLDLNVVFVDFYESKVLLTFLIEEILKDEVVGDFEGKYKKPLINLIKNHKLSTYTLSNAFGAILAPATYNLKNYNEKLLTIYSKLKETFLSKNLSLNTKYRGKSLIQIIFETMRRTFYEEEDEYKTLYSEFKNLFLDLLKKDQNVDLKDTYKLHAGKETEMPLIFLALEVKDLDIIKEFIKRAPEVINMIDPSNKQPFLIYVCTKLEDQNLINMLNILLESPNIDLNIKDEDGASFYSCLINSGLIFKEEILEIFRKLYKNKKLDVNFKINDTPLIQKLLLTLEYSDEPQKEMIEFIKEIINDKNINLDEANENGQTAIFAALKAKDLELIKLIAFKNIDINHKDNEGNIPINYFMNNIYKFKFFKEKEEEKINELLLSIISIDSINLNIPNNDGILPLDVLSKAKRFNLLKEVREKFYNFCREGREEELKNLIETKFPKDELEEYLNEENNFIWEEDGYNNFKKKRKSLGGASGMLLAASKGKIGIMKVLLEYGADPDKASGTAERTPLIGAAQEGYTEVVDFLLKLNDSKVNGPKVNVEAEDVQGYTALYHAIFYEKYETALLLSTFKNYFSPTYEENKQRNVKLLEEKIAKRIEELGIEKSKAPGNKDSKLVTMFEILSNLDPIAAVLRY